MFIKPNNNLVPALKRAYRLLDHLVRSPWPLGISALARDLGLSKSSVHALVHTLADLGFLEKAPEDGRLFQPAGTLWDFWKHRQLAGPLPRAARPFLTDFSARRQLTTLAGVFSAGRVLVVEGVVAPGFGLAAYSGQVLPAWIGALGKLLLASLDPEQARRLTPAVQAHSPLAKKDYLAELERTRISGAALDQEEYLPGVSALAAALPSGRPLRAVWAVGLAPALDLARLEELTPEIRDLAAQVAAALNHEEDRRLAPPGQTK